MKRNDYSNRLSKRDLLILCFVAEQECVLLSSILKYLEIKGISVEIRSVRYSIDRLVNFGLLTRRAVFPRSTYVVFATSAALTLIGLPPKRGEKIITSQVLVAHSVAVARVRLEYETFGGIWTCERRLRKMYDNTHLPDGMVQYQNKNYLIEIDRTVKGANRLQTIMSVNSAQSNIDEVHYWAPYNMLNFIQLQINRLDTGTKNKLKLYQLPQEVDR